MTAAGTGRARPASVRAAVAETRAALAEVLASPGRRAGFALAGAGIAAGYTIVLPFSYTQRFGLGNWDYLNASLLAWAIVLGAAMALVLTAQVYAMRTVAVARARTGAAGGAAFVVSIASSMLCCTPFLATLLAFIGVSGTALYTTTGTLQYFFATNQTGLFAASLALLLASGWWALRKVARAGCLSGEGCALGDQETSGAGGTMDAALPPGPAREPAGKEPRR